MTKSLFINNLFEKFNRVFPNYFVIGEYDLLPNSTGNSDLDILVSDYSPKEINESIIKCLNDIDLKLVSFYSNDYGLFYRISGCDNNNYWGLQLDVFYKAFNYHSVTYYPAQTLGDFVLKHNGINVLRKDKAYFIGFLKEIIHKGWAKDKYKNEFFNILRHDSTNAKCILDQHCGKKFSDYLFENIDNLEKLDDYSKLRHVLLQSLKTYRANALYLLMIRLKNMKRMFKHPGYSIVFLGTDGSGKSTIINEVKPILLQSFHNSVYYEHLRPNLIPSIAKLLGKAESFEGPVTDPHAKVPSGFVGSFVRWSYYMIDYTLGYWLKVFPKRSLKSCVWIFDRYYYDYRIDKRRTRVNLPDWMLRFGQAIIPEPDIIICLGTDAEKIYARKPELELKEVERQVNTLKEFCAKHKRAHWVDTGGSIEQSVSDSMKIIVAQMSKNK